MVKYIKSSKDPSKTNVGRIDFIYKLGKKSVGEEKLFTIFETIMASPFLKAYKNIVCLL